MDLSKFVSLLQERKLYFARADNLGDPFEGTVGQLNALEVEALPRHRATEPKLASWANMSDHQLREVFSQMSEIRRYQRTQIYVSCWHMNEFESAAMWKLYSQSNDSICIQTRYDLLAELLPNWAFAGQVEYLDYENSCIPGMDTFSPFLRKRKSFEHERELRAVVWAEMGQGTPDSSLPFADGGVKIEIDLDRLIEGVYVNATSPEWFSRVVAGLLGTHSVSKTVYRSGLSATPIY